MNSVLAFLRSADPARLLASAGGAVANGTSSRPVSASGVQLDVAGSSAAAASLRLVPASAVGASGRLPGPARSTSGDGSVPEPTPPGLRNAFAKVRSNAPQFQISNSTRSGLQSVKWLNTY